MNLLPHSILLLLSGIRFGNLLANVCCFKPVVTVLQWMVKRSDFFFLFTTVLSQFPVHHVEERVLITFEIYLNSHCFIRIGPGANLVLWSSFCSNDAHVRDVQLGQQRLWAGQEKESCWLGERRINSCQLSESCAVLLILTLYVSPIKMENIYVKSVRTELIRPSALGKPVVMLLHSLCCVDTESLSVRIYVYVK